VFSILHQYFVVFAVNNVIIASFHNKGLKTSSGSKMNHHTLKIQGETSGGGGRLGIPFSIMFRTVLRHTELLVRSGNSFFRR
jgi:hypothetical protein